MTSFFSLIKTSDPDSKLTTLSLLSQKPAHFRPQLVTFCTALKWEGVLCSLILIASGVLEMQKIPS